MKWESWIQKIGGKFIIKTTNYAVVKKGMLFVLEKFDIQSYKETVFIYNLKPTF
jgi:hypothetical protein